MTQQEFTTKYFPFANVATRGTGISPYLILAQAFLESGAGESLLAKKFNNFFGVKAYPGWPGKTIALRTKEQDKAGKEFTITSSFIVFNNPADSFAHQIKFLQKMPRYTKAGLFAKPYDYKHQADSLQKAGYATDINYSRKLTALSNTFANAAKKLAKNAIPGTLLIALALFFF
jgi:flagellum-specific peptidoglycan hydrolase FlgJ